MTEVSVENQSCNDNKSFRIKGHHLSTFAFLLRKEPHQAAQSIMDFYRLKRLNTQDSGVQFEITDTIGSTEEQLQRFGENLECVFEEFDKLPDNSPIEIVEGSRDQLCKRCVTGPGIHCISHYCVIDNFNYFNHDRDFVDFFIKCVNKDGFTQQVATSTELRTFIDAPDEETRVISITAGVLKIVLNNHLW